MSDNFKHIDTEKESIDFSRIFRYVLMQSKLIISIVAITFTISIAYYLTATKTYKITSLLQVEASNQNILDPTNTLDFSSGSTMSDINNLVKLYKSRTNMINTPKNE